MMHVVTEILFFPISNPCGGEGLKADRKYEVLARLVYGVLDGKASAAEYATHKKLLEARCPGQDKSMIVVVA
jgi:hypothetical protein